MVLALSEVLLRVPRSDDRKDRTILSATLSFSFTVATRRDHKAIFFSAPKRLAGSTPFRSPPSATGVCLAFGHLGTCRPSRLSWRQACLRPGVVRALRVGTDVQGGPSRGLWPPPSSSQRWCVLLPKCPPNSTGTPVQRAHFSHSREEKAARRPQTRGQEASAETAGPDTCPCRPASSPGVPASTHPGPCPSSRRS